MLGPIRERSMMLRQFPRINLRYGALAAAAALLVAAGLPARSQAPASPKAEATPRQSGAIDERQYELRGVEETIRASEAQRKQIEAELESMRNDRARLNAALIQTAEKVQKAEKTREELEHKLAESLKNETAIQQSLESRRAIIGEILAGLQRMGRQPPPALLISSNDIMKAIRTAMMLGGVVPELRAETLVLVSDLEELQSVRKRIAADREALAAEVKGLESERFRLAALVEARQKAIGEVTLALQAERQRAAELARKATNLKDLISAMEKEIASARRAAEAARAAEEKRQKMAALPRDVLQAPFGDKSRTAPAIAFAEARGKLPLPVSGSIAKKFGEKDDFGGVEKGLSLAVQAGAAVASPCDGWVSFAGPYRTYGQLLIINAGNGYYIVLAGMERINVEVGQFVQVGEPVAAMGDGSARSAAALAIGAKQPILYVEFRKDGAAIDPDPWWVKPEVKKVRG